MTILFMILPWLIGMFLAALVTAYGARRLAEVKSIQERRVYGR